MASFDEIEKASEQARSYAESNYERDIAMSERFAKAQQAADWNNHPFFDLSDANKSSRNPIDRTFNVDDIKNIKSDAGTIAWNTFRKSVLDLNSFGDKAEMALGNTLAGISGNTVGTEMRDRAADNLMKTMEESRFIDANYGDADSWTARWVGGAMSMAEMIAIGALTSPVGLGAYVGTLSLSDGALNDAVKYAEEHNGSLEGYKTDPANLALDYLNAVFQVVTEEISGTGRLVNGKVFKAGSVGNAVLKETLLNTLQESAQGLATDVTEVLKGNQDIDILSENAVGYIKDGIVAGVLGGVIGGAAYKLNKNRALTNLDKINKVLHPEMNEKEVRAVSESVFEKTEQKMNKSFAPELVAHAEAVNDRGKIRENIRQKVEMMYRDNEDMTEKQKAKAIETTTTLELENMLYDSIEKKIPLTAHPLLQGEVNELGWFRDGIPENRRAEINALNDEIKELKAQRTQAMESKDYNKLDELETKIDEFRKNLPNKIRDLVVADREEIKKMLDEQRQAVENSQTKKRLFAKVKQMARSAIEKQEKEEAKLAEQMALGAEKARAKREKAETAQQTKEAKIRNLAEQRQVASSIKRLKSKIDTDKANKAMELKYAINQATDDSLRRILKNRDWNEYTVNRMKRSELKRAVKELKGVSAYELIPMTTREISLEQEREEVKQEKPKTAKGFFHRKINRDFANESGILQAWGYSKYDSAVNLVFVKDGGIKDWNEIVMELQSEGYLSSEYTDTYETTDMLESEAKDIVLNNKNLTLESTKQAEIDYTEDVGYDILKENDYTDAEIQDMSYEQMSEKLSELYKKEQTQAEEPELTEEELADIDAMLDIEFQETFDLADENARLDDMNPEYTGETIEVDGKERTVYNSNGDRIAKSKEALTNFWRWFGDSKVVDEQGRPLVVYHGTSSEFDTFDNQYTGQIGFYFTANKEYAKTFKGNRVIEAYLKIENMPDAETFEKVDEKAGGGNPRKQIRENLAKMGYDGYTQSGMGGLEYIAFEPNQIKSVDNRGTFDSDTGNIYKQSKVSSKGISEKSDKDRGYYQPEYRFIAMTENMDASTLAHELAHDWGQEYFRWARSGKASESFMRSWGAVEKAIGITGNDTYFTYDASEKFARAYEGWLLERKDWADILHIDNDEQMKAVEEMMEDYRKELVDIYDSLTNPYFTMAWGKVGELKPELKEWFERSTKFDSLDEQVRRGEITAEQASEEKLKDLVETAANNATQNMSTEDKQATKTIENLEKLEQQTKETANRFDVEGGNRNAIQARLNQIALAKDLTANDAVLERYDTHRDMLAVAKAADEFVRNRQADAIKIINGEMAEQDGLFASDLYTALERVAKQTGDFELIDELRHSQVAKELAKELGQRVAGFRNYTGNGDLDIVSALKKVDKIYEKSYNETDQNNLSADLQAWAEDLQAIDSLADSNLDEFFRDMECQ